MFGTSTAAVDRWRHQVKPLKVSGSWVYRKVEVVPLKALIPGHD